MSSWLPSERFGGRAGLRESDVHLIDEVHMERKNVA